MGGRSNTTRTRRRRWPWILGGVVLTAAIVWPVVERLINADHYRPLIYERVKRATGLDSSIGHIDLSLLPIPSAHLRDVTVGEGDFKAQCADVTVYPHLESLGLGKIDLKEITLNGLDVTLPESIPDARARIEAIGPEQPAEGGGGTGKISVGSIRAYHARLFRGNNPDPVLAVDATIQDVLSAVITVTAQGAVPLCGPDARLDGALTLTRGGDPDIGLGVKGDVKLKGIDTTTLVKTRNIPSGVADLDATLERTGKQTFVADLKGDATPHPLDGVDIKPLVGNFTAKAWWDKGTITINDLVWKADAVDLAGDASVTEDGEVAAEVSRVNVTAAGLDTLFAFRPDLPVRLHAEKDASFSARDVLLGFTKDRYLRLVKGETAFNGLDVALKNGDSAFRKVRGTATFKEGVIALQRVEAEGVSLKGSVEPDFATGVTKVDLSGNAELSRERLLMFLPAPQISEARGRVNLTAIKATIVPGEGVPSDLVIEGTLRDGALGVKSDAWTDRFDPVSADFTASPGQIETQVTSQSTKLGKTVLDGTYLLDERQWKGKASGDLSKMDLPFLQQESAKKVAPGIVRAYGQSAFDATLDLPGPKRSSVAITFARQGSPALKGSLAWVDQGGAWSLGDIQIDAVIPGKALQPLVPDAATVDGDVAVIFARSAEKNAFDAHIDLKSATLTMGNLLRKAPGDSAEIGVTGEASPALWSARSIDIQVLGENVQGHFEDARFVIPKLDVDAGPLSKLLARGGEVKGPIRGRAATNPTEVSLTVDGLGVALSPQVALDSVSGAITVRQDGLDINGLAVRGANSDCSLTLSEANGKWSGRVTGQQLDVNGLEALLAGWNAYQNPEGAATPPEDGAAEKASGGFTGAFAVDAGTLLYKQAQFTNASADVAIQHGRIRVNNLSLQEDGGTIAGSVEVDPPSPVGRFATNLNVENVDASLIDQLAFVESRQLRGRLNGTVSLEMPMGGGVNPANGLNGAVVFTGKKGSFGKLGIASKILSVLRVTEITRLRVPTLKDEGLSYDTCDGNIVMDNGLMTIKEMKIKTPSYLITVIGTINFPAQQTELLAHADLLETVLGPGEAVPGVKEVVDKFRTMGGLRILVTGPPDNPETRYAWGPPVAGAITDDVRRAMKSTGGLIKDEVLNRASDALKNILAR